MKKVLTLIVLAVAMAMPSQAQVKFGLQGGLNLTNISVKEAAGNPAAAIKSRTGFFIGPTVRFTLPIVGLGVDAAALYDQREGKVEGGETFKSQSIQIPINARYGFGLGSLAEIFLFAGPQFGFNVGGKKSIEALGQEVGEWTLKSSNLSANVGLGAMIMGHLQAKINYNFALGKTGEVNAKDVVTGLWNAAGSAKMNAWQISLAYYF